MSNMLPPQSARIFDREQWLARSKARREQEYKTANSFIFQQALIGNKGPNRTSRMTVQNIAKLPYTDFVDAVRAFNVGGMQYHRWKVEHSVRPSSLVGAFPTARRSATALPMSLPPLGGTMSAHALHGRGHLDQELEFWRSGHAAGSINPYDGVIDAPGHNDSSRVTEVEMQSAHDQIADKAGEKWATFQKAFRQLDANSSGKVDKSEFIRILMYLNLSGVREKVLMALADAVDTNRNGLIDYNEFCRLLTREPLFKSATGGSKLAPIPAQPLPSVPVPAPSSIGHVDHNLEFFREGLAAGGINMFDGKVDAVAENDATPPTESEIQEALKQLKTHVVMRSFQLRKAFRNIDEDKDGKVSELEFLRTLMMMNQKGIREATMKALAKRFDHDGNGSISFNEFCDMMT